MNSENSLDIPGMIDSRFGDEFNTIQYVADNLPDLLLLIQKLAGQMNLAGLLDTKLDAALLGATSGVAPLGSDSKIPSTFISGGSVADHVAANDPHTQYLTPARGDIRYAGLDGTGKINASFLPSYVDDILEYDNTTLFPSPGERGKLYISVATNGSYRWSGSTYILVGDGAGNGSLGSTDALVEGGINQYFTTARVRATTLLGLDNTVTGTPVATDSMLVAFNKITNYMINKNFDAQYAPINHSHSIAQVVGLQAALDNKQATGSYILTSNFTFTNLTGKPTTLAGYGITDAALASHNHDATYQRKITSGTADPTGGVDGDVYFKVA